MNLQRRSLLRLGASALAATLLWPLRALAGSIESAFKAKTLDEVFKELGVTPTPSDQIVLTTPDIAENGAVVPVSVVSKLANSQQILLLVEKNPNPVAAVFDLPEGTEGFISTRVKIGQTCKVYAVVKADGQYYSAMRETKVTLGGCGG